MIKVTDLVKKYGDLTAVDNVSFSVDTGEVFAFLGPNGAGKTTTIKMLTTLLRPTSGQVLLDGKDVTNDPMGTRKSFGIVFQDPSLDNELTALENMQFHAVLFGLSKAQTKERIYELLELVQLQERKDQYVKYFSGGMKRRLEIARGLLHKPKVLFLDEPTLGLDPQTRKHVWEYIHNLNKKEKVTVFFTTHHMDEVDRIADRIAIIDHGKILTQGTPAQIRAEAGMESLEDAFISLTGYDIREEEGDVGKSQMKVSSKMGNF